MLRRLVWIALAALASSAHGGSVLEMKQYAAEIPLAALALPIGNARVVELAGCDGCPRRRLRLASDATYVVNGRGVTRTELTAWLEHARATNAISGRGIVAVLFDAVSRDVESITVSMPDRVVPASPPPRASSP